MQAGIMVNSGAAGEYTGWGGARMWARALEIAEAAERLGFTFAWVGDHLRVVLEPEDAPAIEAFTLLTAMAERTERIRLGAGVACVGFRNPALLVRMASTLDLASGGRMDFTLGAGWHEGEWRSYGYGYPPARERLAQLEDALEIATRMLRPGRATWSGEHFSVEDVIAEPKGLQQPRMPIIVGGNGRNVTWRLAARYADELNLDGPDIDGVREALPIIRQRCEEAGRDPASLAVSTFSWWPGIDRHQRVEQLQELRSLGLAKVFSLFVDAVESDEPLISFAEDCRAAGVELHSART
jgi:alkanesulfonate monooxygenase SsuD/methylene tetrahydromethanopterin reductase-like flavin-dependent oxidoreductase (luciferase family)